MSNYFDEIKKLKKQKNAVILAHNYQLPEIQDVADFVGDSLGLSQQAAKTDADIIVFCGVHFMAETASIISPDKKVLIPDLEAGCSLASTIDAEQLNNWKLQHPNAVIVSYINTTAEVKALSDYCCTSSNAVKIVESIPNDKEILFLPDKFLGQYVKTITNREIFIWDGFCHVHEKIGDDLFENNMEMHPNAEFLIHPECGCSSSCLLKSTKTHEDNLIKITNNQLSNQAAWENVTAHYSKIHVFSTQGMINYANESESKEFVVATEIGLLHRLKKLSPNKTYFPASENSICEYMKLTTSEKLLNTLRNEEFIVKVPNNLAEKARLPIERMLNIK